MAQADTITAVALQRTLFGVVDDVFITMQRNGIWQTFASISKKIASARQKAVHELTLQTCMHAMTNRRGETIAPPKTKPKVDVDTLTMIDPSVLEDSFVYVHCYFKNTYKDMLIRIWKTTFLIDQASGARSGLVHAENISFAPVWTQIPDNKTYSFLLIFSGLPKSCTVFNLVEEIPQPGGFYIPDIARNKTDVYHIDIK
jgi:hypothetical protein